jgi:dihydroneopterin aldolase
LTADHVRLNDIVLFAHLGVTEAEREVGQRIHIDVDLTADFEAAAHSDHLADTINYETVYRTVASVVEASRYRLLEALALSVIRELFRTSPATSVRVRIRKPNVPFAGSLASAEVEMVRER